MRAEDLVGVVDQYLDAAPRSSADVVPIGPFCVFVTRGPWGYYARPTLPINAVFLAEEVEAVVLAQRARAQTVAFEWIADTAPGLALVCRAAGLVVTERPLLVREAENVATTAQARARASDCEVVVLSASSPDLIDHRRVAQVAFSHGGTSVGATGLLERDLTPDDPMAVEWSRSRVAAGLTIAVVAIHGGDGVVGAGSAQPVRLGDGKVVAELVGIAVLPSHRCRGIADAITRALIDACLESGAELLLLSAADAAVARIYERVGFRRVATFAEAAAAAPTPV